MTTVPSPSKSPCFCANACNRNLGSVAHRRSGEGSRDSALSSGLADAIAYGMQFIANPDLVARYSSESVIHKTIL